MTTWLPAAWPFLLGAALLIGGTLTGRQARWAAALLGGFGSTAAQVGWAYLDWTQRHPAGTLDTYLTVHHVHPGALTALALLLTGVNWAALWLLAHLNVPRTLGGPLLNVAVHLAVPVACAAWLIGADLLTPWPLRGALGVVAGYVALATWTAGVSGSLTWDRPDPAPANVRREWRVPLTVTAAHLLILLAALIW